MTTLFILHPAKLMRTAETLVDEADRIGAARYIERPDTGWCDHGWFDNLIGDAGLLERAITFNAWRVNALAHAAAQVDGEVALMVTPYRPVS